MIISSGKLFRYDDSHLMGNIVAEVRDMLANHEDIDTNRTLIVNFGGSPKAALEQFQIILPTLPHAVALLRDNPGAEQGH